MARVPTAIYTLWRVMPTKVPSAKIEDDKTDLQPYQCERCGYGYKKVFDYPPFLCYRCMRFVAKRTFTIMHTIQPPISRPEVAEI